MRKQTPSVAQQNFLHARLSFAAARPSSRVLHRLLVRPPQVHLRVGCRSGETIFARFRRAAINFRRFMCLGKFAQHATANTVGIKFTSLRVLNYLHNHELRPQLSSSASHALWNAARMASIWAGSTSYFENGMAVVRSRGLGRTEVSQVPCRAKAASEVQLKSDAEWIAQPFGCSLKLFTKQPDKSQSHVIFP